MQILRAKYGKQYNFTADPETLQKLRHCRQFAECMLELKASEGVLLRRAVELLVDHYDKLCRKLKRGNKDAKAYEINWLKQMSEPIFYYKLPEIPKNKPFMSYEARLARKKKNPLDRILKDASRGCNSEQTYRYWE